MTRGVESSGGREEESEGMRVWRAALESHLGAEREALVVRAMRSVGLNELVVEEESWFWNKVEQFVGVWDVWDFKELDNKEIGEVYAVSESVGVDLLQLVHNK
ncbi:hypothetical protein Acr_07g0003900 [Actinidia rufa]|uniref:Uncharacterized protein n=1 Tax=Actinidia rufa TaxID=165716 RepID=A0A7J0EUV8_9ERIC|nr:hypothetical protein Acr_07g0003900 [Actinidia rufa]